LSLVQTSVQLLGNNPLILGQPTNFTGVISSAASEGPITGTITLRDSAGTTFQTVSLPVSSPAPTPTEEEVFFSNDTILPLGTYQVTAVYSGDSIHAGSTSAVFALTVELPTPNLAVSFSSNPVVFDGSYTATATLSGGDAQASPTGSITWPAVFGGATTPLDGLTATTTQVATTPGALSGTVSYSGDSNNGPTSIIASLTVDKATPTLSVVFSPNPVEFGQSYTTTATVSGGSSPTGTVTFPSFVVGPGASPVALSGGTASVNETTNVAPQTITGTFTYNGDASNNAVSATGSLTITQAPQTITFGALASQAAGAAPFSVSATASSGLPVTFTSLTPDTCTVSGSTVTIIGSGTCTIEASQAGNNNFAAATPVDQSFTVTAASPTITVVFNPNPVAFVDTYTGTATLSGGFKPTGTVTWPEVFGGSVTPVAPDSIATLAATSPTAVGTFTGTVTYNGDANNSSATTSPTLVVAAESQVINFIQPTTPVNLSVNQITLVATGGASGNPVVFSIVSGPATVVGNILTITGPGTVVIAANQAGNADFAQAPQVTRSILIDGFVPTFTQLFSSSTSTTAGMPVTLSALVSTGGHTPTGTVTFTSNGTAIGSAIVSTVSTTNLLTFSNQFGQGNWALRDQFAAVPTLTLNNQADPFGGGAASTLAFPVLGAVNDNSWIENATGITPAAGSVYTMSVWLKANQSSVVALEMTESNSDDTVQVQVNVTNTWQRFSLTSGAFDGTAELLWRVLEFGPSPATTVFIYGAQLEQSSSVGPYVQTGATSASGNGGFASITTTTLPVGSDAIIATYNGDASDQVSSSSAVTVVVAPINVPVFADAYLLIGPLSTAITVNDVTWHAFSPVTTETIVDAVHAYLNETILLTSAGKLLQMIPGTPPVDTDFAQASIVLSNITSQTFTHLDATPPYNGSRVLTLFGPEGVLMLQVDDGFVVEATLALGANNTNLFGSSNVQWVTLSEVESLNSGSILVGTADSNGNAFETEYSLATRAVVRTFDSTSFNNLTVTTGDFLFQAVDPYSGVPIAPILVATGTGSGVVSLAWTQTRPDLVNSYTIQVSSGAGTVLMTTIPSGTTAATTLTGLATGNTYAIQMVANSNDGISAPSNIITVSV
jgi:hypothetical protein